MLYISDLAIMLLIHTYNNLCPRMVAANRYSQQTGMQPINESVNPLFARSCQIRCSLITTVYIINERVITGV